MKDHPSNRKTEGRPVVYVAAVAAVVAAFATLAMKAPIEDAVIGDEVYMATTTPPSFTRLANDPPTHVVARARADDGRHAETRRAPGEVWNADDSARGTRPDTMH